MDGYKVLNEDKIVSTWYMTAFTILNKEQKQTGNFTLNVGSDLKEKRTRKYNPPEAVNITHSEPTQANAANDMTEKNDNTQPANVTLNTDLGNKDKGKRECDRPNTSEAQPRNRHTRHNKQYKEDK